MASFLWGNAAQSDFDALLDKTTSDLLPNSTPPDLASSLELADRIRSSAITPAAATKSLLRRLNHDNPNVQLLALAVFDICVKNGGNAFLVQVAGRDVTNDLENLARGRMDGNRQVREMVLTRVQDWATAFMGKDTLRHSELVRTYDRMRGDGLPFPPRDPTATAAMIDSLSAPEWTDSTYCSRCRTDFSLLNRKHHCRNCGNVFDQGCSSQSTPLPHFGVIEPVRVCDGCLRKVREGRGASGLSRSTSLGGGGSDRIGMPERSSTMSYPGGKRQHGAHRTSSSTSAIRSGGGRSKEEEDFQKAIAASLLDVGSGASSTSGPAFELRNPPPKDSYNSSYSRSAPTQSYGPPSNEPDDPELAAAIAASLRDLAPPASAPRRESYGSRYATNSGTYYPEQRSAPPVPRYAPLPTYDLSSSESTSLENFSASVLEGPNAGQRMGERERMLYEKARSAVPRLERGLEDASRRREILVEMNEKLGEATRLYEGMLEERVRGASERVAGSTYGANPYPAQQQAYRSPPQQPYYPAQPQQYLPNTYASSSAPLPPSSYAPYSPQQSYAPQQPYAPPQLQAQPTASAPPPQPQAPVPNAYYKPSSFPTVPQGLPLPVNFPSVPADNPWEEEEKQKASVGELIEL